MRAAPRFKAASHAVERENPNASVRCTPDGWRVAAVAAVSSSCRAQHACYRRGLRTGSRCLMRMVRLARCRPTGFPRRSRLGGGGVWGPLLSGPLFQTSSATRGSEGPPLSLACPSHQSRQPAQCMHCMHSKLHTNGWMTRWPCPSWRHQRGTALGSRLSSDEHACHS